MKSQELKKLNLPDGPGIYFFKKGKKILYVGKATSLRDRVRSYFSSDLIDTRGPLILKMVKEATTITYTKTASVLEALILEANTIKNFQPIYNSKEKDDKSYNYVVITDEKYPRVLLCRGRELERKKSEEKIKSIFGPFPHSGQLKEALKITRKIFPFRDKCIPKDELKDPNKARPCFNRQIGMCPGVCTGEVGSKEYKSIVRNIELFFSGKKRQIETNLKLDMKQASKELHFEKANEIKNQLFALNHIRDVSLLKQEINKSTNTFRIEAYDIAHTSGTETVGVMTVVENGEINKNEYRKFKIQGQNGKVAVNDVKNLKEVLVRRLGHAEWDLPQLIVVDGGVAQINAAKEVLKEKGFDIDIVSVVKDERHNAREILEAKKHAEHWAKSILLANNEAHRFAITYHRKSRRNSLF